MKAFSKFILLFLLFPLMYTSCLFSDDPIDEDGLLITGRTDCYVSRFELLGTDYVTVHARDEVITMDNGIDTIACTIHVEVKYGTDLKNVYPRFHLSTDSKLDPKVPGFMDFSDIDNPKQFTVISGNRKIRKPYTIYITQQEFQP
ncbi:MAG: hypothetical protein LUG18_02655 [Candidatus Azobacteroides sp.]|nr:hypothetical protein [Candidatus Azobacteroides sp.]